MTVADMNRLEHAARISMGSFQETDSVLPSLPYHALASARLGGIVALAAIVCVALLQLVR